MTLTIRAGSDTISCSLQIDTIYETRHPSHSWKGIRFRPALLASETVHDSLSTLHGFKMEKRVMLKEPWRYLIMGFCGRTHISMEHVAFRLHDKMLSLANFAIFC